MTMRSATPIVSYRRIALGMAVVGVAALLSVEPWLVGELQPARDDASLLVAEGSHAASGPPLAPPVPTPPARTGRRVDAFAVRTWEPPPAAPLPPSVLPAPPPQAPPLPYRFVGRIDDPDAGTLVFLTAGVRLVSVRSGDVIDGRYRVDAIESSSLRLVHLPSNQAQSLPLPQQP